jgi:hypothetical protein
VREQFAGWRSAVIALLLVAIVGTAGWLFLRTDDQEGSAEELCALLADRSRFSAVVEGFDPSDVSRSLDQLRLARDELVELRAAAPAELHPDLDVQIEATDALIGALEQVDPGDTTAAHEALRSVEPELAGVAGAYARLEQWASQHCS